MIPIDRLEQISQRFQFLEASMAAGADGADFAALAKEYADLTPIVEVGRKIQQMRNDMADLGEMIADPDGDAG